MIHFMHYYVLSTLTYMHHCVTVVLALSLHMYSNMVFPTVRMKGETEIVDSDDDSDLSTVNVEDETTKV